MGVRGLSTFFNQNPHLSKHHLLHDTPVILDGNNLVFILYFSHNLDCIYGGDFDKFASVIERYFASYSACNIKPIVIFDGGLDKSERKIQTVLQRHKRRLTLTQHIAKYNSCFEKVLPNNAFQVFKDVIAEIGISHAQCDFEADDQLTALANHYKCPVISEDSDFYIFDLSHGFIRLQSIEPHVVEHVDENGKIRNVLKCKIYHIDDFLAFFPGIEKNVLPLFGTLMGNDYVPIDTFSKFFSNTKLPKFKSKRLHVSERQRKMIGLLCWLKHSSLQEAIQLVLGCLKQDQRQHVRSIIEQAISDYIVPNCNLTLIIDGKENVDSYIHMDTKLTRPCGQPLPPWFIHKFNSSVFPPCFLNVISMNKGLLPSQVEDIKLDSTYSCSCYIRQVLYGILLRHPDENFVECIHEKCTRPVHEYDRHSGSMKKNAVHPIFHNRDMSVLPMLHELDSINKKCAKNIMKIVLGEKSGSFQLVPPQWKLLVGSIRYLLRNSNSPTLEEFIYSFIINLIYFTMIDKNTPKEIALGSSQDIVNGETNPNTDLMKDIPPQLAEFVINNLNKYLKKPTTNRAKPLVLGIIHSFNQLQTCFIYLIYLNKLLGSPFYNTKIHKSMSGIFVYNFTKDLISRPYPDLFVSEILGRDSVLDHLFFKLKAIILDGLCTTYIVQIDLLNRSSKKKQSKKRQNRDVKNEIVSKSEDVCETLACLNFIGDGDDVDVYL